MTLKEMGTVAKYGPCEVCKRKTGLIYYLVYHRAFEPGDRHVFGCHTCLSRIEDEHSGLIGRRKSC